MRMYAKPESAAEPYTAANIPGDWKHRVPVDSTSLLSTAWLDRGVRELLGAPEEHIEV